MKAHPMNRFFSTVALLALTGVTPASADSNEVVCTPVRVTVQRGVVSLYCDRGYFSDPGGPYVMLAAAPEARLVVRAVNLARLWATQSTVGFAGEIGTNIPVGDVLSFKAVGSVGQENPGMKEVVLQTMAPEGMIHPVAGCGSGCRIIVGAAQRDRARPTTASTLASTGGGDSGGVPPARSSEPPSEAGTATTTALPATPSDGPASPDIGNRLEDARNALAATGAALPHPGTLVALLGTAATEARRAQVVAGAGHAEHARTLVRRATRKLNRVARVVERYRDRAGEAARLLIDEGLLDQIGRELKTIANPARHR